MRQGFLVAPALGNVDQSGLLLPSECWNYWRVSPCLAFLSLFFFPQDLFIYFMGMCAPEYMYVHYVCMQVPAELEEDVGYPELELQVVLSHQM